MLNAILAAMLFAGTPAPAAASELQVDVGRADWNRLPPLKAVQRAMPTPEMVQKVEDMLKTSDCHIRGQAPTHFDITVPYAVQVNPDGSASHVVVAEKGSPALESYVGLIVLQLARNGDFRSNGGSQPLWYASSLNFNEQ
jgi:hypothetical protein